MTEPILAVVDEGRRIEHRGPRSKREVTIDKSWSVELDGEIIGYVHYRLRTREHRTPGRMYVNKRWQSPGWGYSKSQFGRESETYSKKQAVERLVQDHEWAKKNQEQQ